MCVKHVVKTIHHLGLRATLLTEQSFCTALVSSQLGGVASGLRMEMGSVWLTRSIQGLCHQKHLGILNVTREKINIVMFQDSLIHDLSTQYVTTPFDLIK